MAQNTQVLIKSLPEDQLSVDNYSVESAAMPVAGAGEVLCQTLALTVGAGQRAGLQGSASYAGAPKSGVLMNGSAVSRVIESKADNVKVGDVVTCPAGWQAFSAHAAGEVNVVPAGGDPAHNLGVLGTNGLTAYFGLLDLGEPKAGDTVLVSAAAGSVGHIVGQIAKLKGCRVIGTAGTDEKCHTLLDKLGFDAAINYKDQDFRGAFKQACGDGIDIYFDNTGGDILGAALRRMNTHGRIVCCGVVSQYDTSTPAPGPRGIPGLLVNNRVRMEGFLVFDYADQYDDARSTMRGWIESGELVPLQDEFEGIENAPAAFVDMLAGGNIGTRIIRVGD